MESKHNMFNAFVKDVKKDFFIKILLFIIVVAILSFGIYNFLQVPEIVNIIQNEPVENWVKSLISLNIHQALILACIFVAFKFLLYLTTIIFMYVFIPLCIFFILKKVCYKIKNLYQNKLVKRITNINEKLYEDIGESYLELLKLNGVELTPKIKLQLALLDNYKLNNHEYINLEEIDFTDCNDLENLFVGFEDKKIENWDELKNYCLENNINIKNMCGNNSELITDFVLGKYIHYDDDFNYLHDFVLDIDSYCNRNAQNINRFKPNQSVFDNDYSSFKEIKELLLKLGFSEEQIFFILATVINDQLLYKINNNISFYDKESWYQYMNNPYDTFKNAVASIRGK